MASITRTGILGKGAYGIVYDAILTHPTASAPTLAERRKVAVKRLLKEKDVALESALAEFDAVTQCRGHPFLVEGLRATADIEAHDEKDGSLTPLTEHGYDDDMIDNHFHLVFERGECDLYTYLDKRCGTRKDLSAENRIRLIYHLLCALEWLHAHQMLHRDVKDVNCLIFNDPTDPQKAILKLADYGMVKHTHPILPCTPGVYTTINRPPEVILNCITYDERAETWAAGCVAYFILTGQRLFREEQDELLLRELLLVHEDTFETVDDFLDLFPTHDERVAKTQLKGLPTASQRERCRVDLDDALKELPSTLYKRALALLRDMLRIDPEARPTPSALLDTYADLFRAAGISEGEREAALSTPMRRPVVPWTGARSLSPLLASKRDAALVLAKKLLPIRSIHILRHDARILVHAMDAFERFFLLLESEQCTLSREMIDGLHQLPSELIFLALTNYFAKLFNNMSVNDLPHLLVELDAVATGPFSEWVEMAHPLGSQDGPLNKIERITLGEVFQFRSFVPTVFEAFVGCLEDADTFVDRAYPMRIAELCLDRWTEWTDMDVVRKAAEAFQEEETE